MKRFIKIGMEQVEVSEEIYKEYFRMARRERYYESDIKVGTSSEDKYTGKITYTPSKEDSLERIEGLGVEFEDENLVEDIICDKAMLDILNEALKELDNDEQELIYNIYYKNLTTREVARINEISQPAICKRHKKLLDKLKKYFL